MVWSWNTHTNNTTTCCQPSVPVKVKPVPFTFVYHSISLEPKTYLFIILVDSFILLLEVCDSNSHLFFNGTDQLRKAMPTPGFAGFWFSPDSATTGVMQYAPLDGRSVASHCERCKQKTANSCKKKVNYQRRNTKSIVPNRRYVFSFSNIVTLFCSH